jgi:DNA-binding transcriptional ArsR family regulator
VTSHSQGIADLEALEAVFGALAHQSRRTILIVLLARGGEMTSGGIAARFDCSWPTTTRHLRILQDAGLARLALRGRQHVYQLDADRLRSVAGAWLGRFDAGTKPAERHMGHTGPTDPPTAAEPVR